MAKKKKAKKASKGKSKAKAKVTRKKRKATTKKKAKGGKKKKKKGGRKQTFSQMVGARIRQARENAGLSHAQFARKLKVAPPRVSALESGKNEPKLSSVVKIAKVLGTSVGYLAGETDRSPRRGRKQAEEE